jgi:hypothetical protein
MGTKEVGFSENRQDGKEGFGGAHFLLEKIEGMGKGMTDWPTQGAKAKGMEKRFCLIADALGTVLEVLVVKAQTWIDPDGSDSGRCGPVDLSLEILLQGLSVIS